MRRVLAALGMAMAMASAACEGGGDPVQQALRDASAANHAATVRESEPAKRRVAVPEAGMQDGLGAPSRRTADETYIAGMIEHHRIAVAMADVALLRSNDPEVRRMAQMVKDARSREIAEMQAWTSSAAPTP